MSVFVAVADTGSFAGASRLLGMSPPAVTRAVSALEEHVGARLLIRTTRSVQVTDAGARYLRDCRAILETVDSANKAAGGIHAAPSGTVSVTASVLFGRMVLTPLLFGLLDQHPSLSVTTLFVDRVVHLMEEGIDVAIRIADLPDSSLIATRVGSMRRVLCASPAYLDEYGRPRTPADLPDHQQIDFTAMSVGRKWPVYVNGNSKNINLSPRLSFNVADPAIAAAVAGRGITRVLSYMVAGKVASGDLEIVLEEFEPPAVPVHVVHKEGGQTSARIRVTVDHLVTGLRGNPALLP